MNLNKNKDETLKEFCLRMAEEKQSDKSITWQDISDAVYSNYGEFKTVSGIKSIVRRSKLNISETDKKPDTPKDETEDKLLELKKERIKIQDERTQNKAYIRRLAREDTIKEIALSYADKMSSKKFLNIPKEIKDISDRDAILCISDWHYGIEVDNALNSYSPEICKERVADLVVKTIRHCRAYGIKHLNICNLGDLIAGRIHLTLRLESRFDVVTQIMDVSEILVEMIARLSEELRIDYYSCIDNHSRLEPNKTDSLELETLARITDWYLKARLSNNPNVSFKSNKFGPEIITLKCKGHNIAAVHGDSDSPTAASTSIARLTRDTYDLVLMAHRHHFAADELNETLVVSNSSLMGTDQYAFRLRLSAQPSQNLIIVSEDNVTEAIHRIAL